jgi:hypothetical protein
MARGVKNDAKIMARGDKKNAARFTRSGVENSCVKFSKLVRLLLSPSEVG